MKIIECWDEVKRFFGRLILRKIEVIDLPTKQKTSCLILKKMNLRKEWDK